MPREDEASERQQYDVGIPFVASNTQARDKNVIYTTNLDVTDGMSRDVDLSSNRFVQRHGRCSPDKENDFDKKFVKRIILLKNCKTLYAYLKLLKQRKRRALASHQSSLTKKIKTTYHHRLI